MFQIVRIPTLQQLSYVYIGRNFKNLRNYKGNLDIEIPVSISEKIMENVWDLTGELDDEDILCLGTLKFHFRKLRININKVKNLRVLSILRKYDIKDLEIDDAKVLYSFEDVLKITDLDNLERLSICPIRELCPSYPDMMQLLKNLKILEIRFSVLNSYDLEYICHNLINLEELYIGGLEDKTYDKAFVHRSKKQSSIYFENDDISLFELKTFKNIKKLKKLNKLHITFEKNLDVKFKHCQDFIFLNRKPPDEISIVIENDEGWLDDFSLS